MDVSGSKELENVQPPALARNLSDLQNSLSILRLSNKVLSCQVDDQEGESGKVTLAALARIYNLGQVIRVITLVVKISDELAAARNDVVTAKQKFFQMELQNIYYSISDNVKNIIEVCELFPHENLNPHIMEENLNHIRASLLCILELCEKFARADKKSWFNNRMFTWSRSVLRRVYEAKTQLPYEFGQINEMHLIEDE